MMVIRNECGRESDSEVVATFGLDFTKTGETTVDSLFIFLQGGKQAVILVEFAVVYQALPRACQQALTDHTRPFI